MKILKMEFRAYKLSDKSRLLEIFHSNCPKYFDPSDENLFLDFLDKYADENYLVVIKEDLVIACGGHYTKEKNHGIAWVMFAQHSIGHRDLLNTCDRFFQEIESRILAEKKYLDIYINTTQLMERLFNRYGFETFEIIKDGFGKGLDEYKMLKELKQLS